MRSHAGQRRAEYGSRPLASEQVEGKVRVYSVYSVYSGHVQPVQPPEIMNAVTSCLLGSWSVLARHRLRREKNFPPLANTN